MIDDATSGHGPLGSKATNASSARRAMTGSTGPPSGTISHSPRPRRAASLAARLARRSALPVADCWALVVFMPGIVTGAPVMRRIPDFTRAA